MKTLRHTLTTLSLGLGLLLTGAASLTLGGCQDDLFPGGPGGENAETGTRAEAPLGNLQRNSNGQWVASKRVPLVGVGRIVNGYMAGVVDAGDDTGAGYGNVIDTNLDNYAELSGVNVDLLANGIVSVKDLYRTYAPQQTVGFVIGNTSNGSLLDAKLLQFMVISLYNDGKLVAEYNASENSGLLDVGVLQSSDNALQTVAVKAQEAFDEVVLSASGISATLDWNGMRIYYAFVGETPMEYVTTDQEIYKNAKFTDTKNIGGGGLLIPEVDDILNINHTSGVPISAILDSKATPHRTTLNYGTPIPAGTEVGFTYQEFSILDLSVAPTITLTPYKDNTSLDDDIYKQEGLLGLGVLKAGEGAYGTILTEEANKLKFEMEVQVLSLNIGGSSLMRAYTREATQVDPSSYFTTAEEVWTTSSSYLFMKPEQGTLTATLTSGYGDAKLTQTTSTRSTGGQWTLTNMAKGATYVVKLNYTLDNKQFTSTCTIHREAGPVKDCTTHYMTTDNGCKVVEANEIAGITIINWMTDTNYIVDTDVNNNYASQGTGVSLLEGGTIAAVKSNTYITPEGKYRVGFTISNGPGLLGLNALKFFMVDLYKDGEKIDSQVSASNNILSLGVIDLGSQKMRISIETDQTFDCVALRAFTTASALNNFRIYNAFYEDAECEENSVMEACSQLMTPALNGLEIDYTNTGFTGVSVGAWVSGLGNIFLYDENNQATTTENTDKNGASFGSIANLGTLKLGFKFNQQKANNWIGLLMAKPAGLATVDILGSMTVEFTLNGTVQETLTQSEGLLGADLVGWDEKTYIEAYPTKAYDGMIVTFNGADVLQKLLIYGLYTTKDLNGNDTPDCEEKPGTSDEEEGEDKVTVNMNATTEDVCIENGEETAFDIKVTVNGNASTATYYLECLPAAGHGEKKVIPVKVDNNRLVANDSSKPMTLQAGVYNLFLYDEDVTNMSSTEKGEHQISLASVYLEVHPARATWEGTSSSNWHDWDNWKGGVPWTCTDVIIPGNCTYYPVLNQEDYQAKQNNCANLYIKDGGQLVNSFYLNHYDLAWVDIDLQGGRYYLLSSPLKDMVSGDWFTNSEANASWTTFASLTEQNYPEQRTNPTVYQRLWNAPAQVKNPEGYNAKDEVLPDETQWTPPYNALTQDYSLGMGFSLMAGKDNDGSTHTFRFPKAHTTYHYYNLSGVETGLTESVHTSQEANISGRFIYEEASQWKGNNELTVTLKNKHEASAYYLAGNPFMAHIDLKTFMSTNNISEVKVWNGQENNSLILVDGELLSASGNEVKYIKPMEAFFVVGAEGKTLDIKYNTNMLTAGGETRTRSASPAPAVLRLAATLDGHTAHALLRVSPTASAGVVPGEDTKLLVEGEARPAVAIYTVADGRALDIQQVPDDVRRIPLGFYLPGGGKADIRLTPQFTDPEWSDWFLLDLRTGQRRRLTPAAIDLHDVENGSSRYVLVKNEGE